MKNIIRWLLPLIVIGIIPIFIFAFAPVTYAEGSNEIGAVQFLKSDTVLFIDIINPTVETFTWTGTGSITVTSPTGSLIGVFNTGDVIDPVEIGAYRIELSVDQNTPWSVDVYEGSSLLTGRLYSTNWFLNQGYFDQSSAANNSYYALVPTGNNDNNTVIEMRFDGLAGFEYEIAANQSGVDGVMAGMSVPIAGGGNSLNPAGNSFIPTFPIYLNIPETANFTISTPTVTGFTASNIGQGNYIFSFNTDVEGTYRIIIDINGDSLFDISGEEDMSLFGSTSVGINEVTWNGLNIYGAAVPAGEYETKVVVYTGELHFVARDIETIYPGLRLFQVYSDFARSPLLMFWNDTLVQHNLVVMINNEIGIMSSVPLGISSGSYLDSTAPNENAHTWGDFGGNHGKGNEAFVDTFSWIASNDSGVVSIDVTTAHSYAQCTTNLSQCESDLDQCLNPPIFEPEGPGQTCKDLLDNDGDGLIDCDDSDCAKKKHCK